jgi:hypothetical protein
MLSTSVSNVNLFKTWSEEEGLGVDWLIDRILVRTETPAMKAGTAFHAAVENAGDTEHFVLKAMGYTFEILCDMEIALPRLREVSISQEYDGLLVRGRVDGIDGKIVMDLKTTEQFDAERYVDGLAWRYYLDICGADRFDWHVFQVRHVTSNDPEQPKLVEVYNYHLLKQYRYAGLHEDCLDWARRYRAFAEKFLPVSANAA